MVLDAHAAVTPPGNPVGVPMPVAPVVVWVMEVNTVLTHKVGVEEAIPAVLTVAIVICITVDKLLHPPEVTVLLNQVVCERVPGV